MQIKLTQISDGISPALAARLKYAAAGMQIHEAIGLAITSLAKRAFTETSLRPSSWPTLHGGGTATLCKTGTLKESPRVISARTTGVTVGSDRRYAAIHQLGGVTKPHVIRAKSGGALNIPGIGFRKSVNHPGSKIPARPYFPFQKDGKPTPAGHTAILEVIEAMLRDGRV